jgi:hypothetical protein
MPLRGAALPCEDRGERVALECNCSICFRRGFLHFIVAEEDFEATGEAAVYRFGTRTAVHTFCPRCGDKPYYRPRSHPEAWSVNLRCVDDRTVIDTFEVRPFDGLHWEEEVGRIRGLTSRSG